MTHATPGPVSGDDAAPRPLVQLSGVQKHFGDLHVLKDIDLEVAAGEVVVVLGPSGSGKSTLCRTINRLETIDEGEIRIDGTVLPTSGKGLAALRSEVGMVFQSFNLLPMLTAEQNILLPLELAGTRVDRAWLDTLTSAFGIADRLDHLPSQLSGGQIQRVAISRARWSPPRPWSSPTSRPATSTPAPPRRCWTSCASRWTSSARPS